MKNTCIQFDSINKPNTIFILAYIIDSCNYSCPYCFNIMPRTNKKLNLTLLYNFIIFLNKLTNKNIEIELIGGEPTLHQDILFFCKKISALQYVKCSIYSNFSNNILLYNDLLKYNIGFTLSLHYPLINNFINKLDQIPITYFYKNNINIRIMFEIDHYSEIKNICYLLLKKYKKYFEPALIQYNDLQQYSTKYLELYNTINNMVRQKYVYIARYSNNQHKLITVNDAEKHFKCFKYWKCNAGLEYFYIHANGNIYNCINQYIYNQSPNINIYSDFTHIKLKSMICMYDDCPCIWEVHKKRILNI